MPCKTNGPKSPTPEPQAYRSSLPYTLYMKSYIGAKKSSREHIHINGMIRLQNKYLPNYTTNAGRIQPNQNV